PPHRLTDCPASARRCVMPGVARSRPIMPTPGESIRMPDRTLVFDADAAVARLMRFLAVEGITGQELAIGRDVVDLLLSGGVPRKQIRFDEAHKKIPLPTQTGNLIVTLPGTMAGPRRLFMTHLDTVPLCAGAVPVRKGERIVPAAQTAL